MTEECQASKPPNFQASMKKLLDILHALCLALAAWLQGRRKRAANQTRSAVANHDRQKLNEILQERRGAKRP